MSSSASPATTTTTKKRKAPPGAAAAIPVVRAGDPVRRAPAPPNKTEEDDAKDDHPSAARDADDDARLARSRQSAIAEPPRFEAAATAQGEPALPVEYRKVRIPAHRYTPLRKAWPTIIAPLTEHLKLQVRFNPRSRCVELKTCAATTDPGALQKGADYVGAFALGFEVRDAVALLRLDDLFIDSFEVKDVKILHGDHLGRAVGRVAGADGKTRFAIENATRTRIVLAHTHVHILGATANIKVARDAVCDLIMGAPPGKVYNRMRTVAKRLAARA